MRLLVITQAVDTEDQALGFFHRWLEELAQKFETLEVICLKEGKHSLPANVHVHSLGKEGAQKTTIYRSLLRFAYLGRLLRYIVVLKYDAVFVHMNEEYVLLGGWWWRFCGKRVVLWRNHKMGSWRTRLAVRLSNTVCYTSPEAFTARYKKALQMPVGIDTGFFVPPPVPSPADTVLFLGRIDPVKKVEVFIEALGKIILPRKVSIYGSPTGPDSAYAKRLAEKIEIHPGVPHQETRALYQSHAIYVNLTPSGSFDKTIGEAMASGCIVVCANEALRGILPEQLLAGGTADSAAKALEYALGMSQSARQALVMDQREYVVREHSLHLLAGRLQAVLQNK
ncbi:MAG: glycosyltransferase family 4 protein [Patescibacteria group bacterium]